jgi:hypothetical protein
MANFSPEMGIRTGTCHCFATCLVSQGATHVAKECRCSQGKMDNWLDLLRVVHDLWLELAALLDSCVSHLLRI